MDRVTSAGTQPVSDYIFDLTINQGFNLNKAWEGNSAFRACLIERCVDVEVWMLLFAEEQAGNVAILGELIDHKNVFGILAYLHYFGLPADKTGLDKLDLTAVTSGQLNLMNKAYAVCAHIGCGFDDDIKDLQRLHVGKDLIPVQEDVAESLEMRRAGFEHVRL